MKEILEALQSLCGAMTIPEVNVCLSRLYGGEVEVHFVIPYKVLHGNKLYEVARAFEACASVSETDCGFLDTGVAVYLLLK